MTFDPDDPRLTAYALGELDDADREPRSRRSSPTTPRPARFVEEIRATARLLTEQLRDEPGPGLAPSTARPSRTGLRPTATARPRPASRPPPGRRWAIAAASSASPRLLRPGRRSAGVQADASGRCSPSERPRASPATVLERGRTCDESRAWRRPVVSDRANARSSSVRAKLRATPAGEQPDDSFAVDDRRLGPPTRCGGRPAGMGGGIGGDRRRAGRRRLEANATGGAADSVPRQPAVAGKPASGMRPAGAPASTGRSDRPHGLGRRGGHDLRREPA